MVILIDSHQKWKGLAESVYKRLCEELAKLEGTLNLEKTRQVDFKASETFNFLGFVFMRSKTKQGKWGIIKIPKMEARTKLLGKLKEVFRRYQSQPIDRVIHLINPILRGWVNYYRIGNSGRCFNYVKNWVEKKAKRQMRARQRQGFGWEAWSRQWLYQSLDLYLDYQIRYDQSPKVSLAG